jgi:metallo-beta-lactamase family protein
VLKQFRTADYAHPIKVGPFTISFSSAGHILGSSCVRIECAGQSITFSGDVGRSHDPVMRPPVPLKETDWLVVESTYGDRLHEKNDVAGKLAQIVSGTIAQGGTVLLPAFAVGRAQVLMYLLTNMMARQQIPHVPIYLDSPMAIDVTEVFKHNSREHRLSHAECEAMHSRVTYTSTGEQSQALSASEHPKIIIAGAGMLNGGRILHHLIAFWRRPSQHTGHDGLSGRGHARAGPAYRRRQVAYLWPRNGYPLPR